MSGNDNLQPLLRERANELLQELPPAQREALMVKCWLSHDARWFMAVAREFGMDVTNRINREAIRETGVIEAQRLIRALKLWPVKSIDECLLAQEAIIGLFGPDLLDYDLRKVSGDQVEVHIRRCFAYENVRRVGVEKEFECGIFARSSGWYQALDVEFEMSPPLGKCLKVLGEECIHTFRYRVRANAG